MKDIKRDGFTGWFLLALNLIALVYHAAEHHGVWVGVFLVATLMVVVGLRENADMAGMRWMHDTWKLP